MIKLSLFLLFGGIALLGVSILSIGSSCKEDPGFKFFILFAISIIITIAGLILTGQDVLIMLGVI